MGDIALNIQNIRRRVEMAARRVNRDPSDVRIIGVTKTISESAMAEAAQCGITDFGENKAQEIVRKHDTFEGSPITWHMIGHLQTNKVKSIINKVSMIHSVDSERLAREISRHAIAEEIMAKIMVEINIANEPSKFGVADVEAVEFVRRVAGFGNVFVVGLMCIAPETLNSVENREYFEKMRKIFIDIKSKRVDNGHMTHLSMGMTGDFEAAVECGSTMVRIGTGIFGARDSTTTG